MRIVFNQFRSSKIDDILINIRISNTSYQRIFLTHGPGDFISVDKLYITNEKKYLQKIGDGVYERGFFKFLKWFKL